MGINTASGFSNSFVPPTFKQIDGDIIQPIILLLIYLVLFILTIQFRSWVLDRWTGWVNLPLLLLLLLLSLLFFEKRLYGGHRFYGISIVIFVGCLADRIILLVEELIYILWTLLTNLPEDDELIVIGD